MSLVAELNSLMIKYHFKPKKKLSQHFLVSESTISKIVSLAELTAKDKVLEVGAGTGFLTRELCKNCETYAIEIDEKLCTVLENEVKCKALHVLCADVLKCELPEFNKVVSVAPYHISRRLLRKLVEYGFDLGVFVFQREFAEKLVAMPGFPEYASITVITQYKMNPEIISYVQPKAFFPKPKAVSAIVKLSKRKGYAKVENEKLFFDFVSELFRYRKKDLKNSLLCASAFIKSRLKTNPKSASIPKKMLQTKVDQLSVGEFIELFELFSE